MKVDVVLLTKNSLNHSSVFERCLNTLYEEIPVNRLIVVDGFSEDGTVGVLEEYPNVEIHQIHGNRAVARQYGIEQVETDWFLFIDDDVILCKNWFKKAKKYISDEIGMIWGWTIDYYKGKPSKKWRAVGYLRHTTLYKLKEKMFKQRGGTHDTLVRSEAVKDIKIPRELHIFEDKYLKEHVETQGYQWIIPRDLIANHYKRGRTLDAKWGCELAVCQYKTGTQNFFDTTYKLALCFPKCLVQLLVTRNLGEPLQQFKSYLYNWYGSFYLQYKRVFE